MLYSRCCLISYHYEISVSRIMYIPCKKRSEGQKRMNNYQYPLVIRPSTAYLLLRLRVGGKSCWDFVHNGAHRCLHGRWGFRATHFSSINSGMTCKLGGGEKRKFTSVSVDHNNISVHYNGNNQKLCCSSITI